MNGTASKSLSAEAISLHSSDIIVARCIESLGIVNMFASTKTLVLFGYIGL